MLNSRTRELISALHKSRASYDAIRDKEIKRDTAYAELEKKCNESLQDLDKNPLKIDILRQDRGAIVSKVVPDATMKLVYSDEMGVLVARLVRTAIIYGRCTTFEELSKLKEPFVLEKMPDYRTSSKYEYD
ncbi:hypothetical protein Tco_1552318 [Tanacetum coccineum]